MFSNRKLVFLSLIFIIVLFSVYHLHENILVKVGSIVIKEQTPIKSDAIIVPGGGNFQRVKKGLELYNEGYSSKFILTGDIKGWPGIDEGTWADLSKRYLLKNGVDEKNIYLIHSTSTREDIIRSFKKMRENNMSSCIIVSTIFHTGRIYKLARKNCENLRFRIVPSENYEYNRYNWWKTEKGLLLFFNEIFKTVYYIYKGYI